MSVQRCGATVDVRDGPYSEPIPWQRCGKPVGHEGSCDVVFTVYYSDADGNETDVEDFLARDEAEQAAEYLMGIRDVSQVLTGCTFEVREATEES
ncbi:MAG TPA: hypothetical protein VGJ60_07235 [Chloroflexota bacterium]|jgi:hypothetical protein